MKTHAIACTVLAAGLLTIGLVPGSAAGADETARTNSRLEQFYASSPVDYVLDVSLREETDRPDVLLCVLRPPASGTYTVHYFVDGRYGGASKDHRLPGLLRINMRGWPAGDHALTIQVESDTGQLGGHSATINKN